MFVGNLDNTKVIRQVNGNRIQNAPRPKKSATSKGITNISREILRKVKWQKTVMATSAII